MPKAIKETRHFSSPGYPKERTAYISNLRKPLFELSNYVDPPDREAVQDGNNNWDLWERLSKYCGSVSSEEEAIKWVEKDNLAKGVTRHGV